jgi:hypothetical protein
MAHSNVTMISDERHDITSAPIGFSWTTLFFGFFVPLFRNDYMWAIIMMVFSVLTLFVSNIPFAFLYNRIYLTKLLKQKYTVCNIEGDNPDKVIKMIKRIYEKIHGEEIDVEYIQK